jgi:hypothetical protein
MHVLTHSPEHAELLRRRQRAAGRPMASPHRAGRLPKARAVQPKPRTGLEPFVLAAGLGLGLWALLLAPLLF